MEKLTVTLSLNLKKNAIMALLIVPALAFAKAQYDETQLEQFNETNICAKCDLSNATVNAKTNAILDESILIGATIKGDLTSSSFIKSILTQSNFNGYYHFAMVSNFQGSTMQYANASATLFSGSNFENANLQNVNFSRANLSSANFNNANIKNAKLNNAILIGSNLTQEQLNSAASYYCAVLPNGTLAEPEYKGNSCR